MSTPSVLEHRLEAALRERAAAMPAPVTTLPEPQRQRPRRPRGVLILTAAVIVVALAVVVALVQPFRGGGQHPTASTTAPTPSSTNGATTTTAPATTTTLPVPPGVPGPEVHLQSADTEDTRFLTTRQRRQDPTARPIVVQITDAAPIIVNGGCMTIALAPPNGTGYQGSCTADPATKIVGAIDTGANVTATSNVYGAWVGVPAGATYVTYEYGDQRAWQRPISGVAYFVQHQPDPPRGGTPLVLRAYDASGRQVGEAVAQPVRLGDGSWSWM